MSGGKESVVDEAEGCRLFGSKRVVIPILAFFGVCIMYIERMSVVQAVVTMANEAKDNQEDFSVLATLLFSSFFLGYIVSQPVGGLLSLKFGGKRMFGIGICISTLNYLLMPFVLGNYILAAATRAFMGVGQGFIYPSVFKLVSQWAPRDERNFFLNMQWSGGQAGTIVILGSFLFVHDAMGLECAFLSYAVLGILWIVLWYIMVEEFPEDHPTISKQEKEYILRKREMTQDLGKKISFSDIRALELAFSPPILAFMIINFCYSWTYYVLMSFIPAYLNNVHGYVNPDQGLLSMTPYIGLWISLMLSGILLDYLVGRGVSLLVTRKILVVVGIVPAAISLFVLSVSHSFVAAFSTLIMAVSLSGISMSGFSSNPLDLSPELSGLIYAICSVVSSAAGMLSPIVTNIMLSRGGCGRNYPEQFMCVEAWGSVFRLCGTIYLLGASVWVVFCNVRPLNVLKSTKGDVEFEKI